MKILAFCSDESNYPESRSLNIHLLDAMARKGHTINVICAIKPYYDGDCPKGITHFVIDLNHMTDEEAYKQNPIFKKGYDLCFASGIGCAKHAVYHAKKMGCKSFVQLLDLPTFRWLIPIYKQEFEGQIELVKLASHIITSTEKTKNTLIKKVGIPENKISVVYYGIDTKVADKIKKRKEVAFDCVYVGRLGHHRAIEQLFYAMALLKKEGIILNTAIIGDGPQSIQLINLAQFLNLIVSFKGCISDKEKFDIIKHSKMIVAPSLTPELSSLPALEAIYCETPVICTDLPINRECLGDWPSYVYPGDISELAGTIKHHLASYSSIRGSQWVLKNRTVEIQAKEILEIFEEK